MLVYESVSQKACVLHVCVKSGVECVSSCWGAEISHLSWWEQSEGRSRAGAAPVTSPYKEGGQKLHIFLKATAPLCTESVHIVCVAGGRHSAAAAATR